MSNIFTTEFLAQARKVQAHGANLVITGDSAIAILLQQPISMPQVAIAWKSEASNGHKVSGDLLEIVQKAIGSGLCTADPSMETIHENGELPSIIAMEKLLSERPFNYEALGFYFGDDDELYLLDHINAVTDILGKTLEPTTNGQANSKFAWFHKKAVMLAGRFGLRSGERLRRILHQDASAWNDITLIERGELLFDLIGSESPSSGLILMHESGILNRSYSRLDDMAGTEAVVVGSGKEKRKYHHKDVFYHTMQVLDNVCEHTDNVWLRFAALLHDVAKPRTKAFSQDTGWTFHGHAEIGARMVRKMFKEFEYPEEAMRYVRKLVALHLRPMALVSEGVTDSAVRRLITDVGDEMEDLLTLCRCDITSKNPGKVTRYLSNYDRLVDTIREVLAKDRLREWQPPITGQEIMDECGIAPGVVVGVFKTHIENAILAGEIENTREAAMRYLHSIKEDILAGDQSAKPASRKQSMNSLPEELDT